MKKEKSIHINWLWDTRLDEKKVKDILKDPENPRFSIYAEKLFSRVDDPAVVFQFIDQTTFARKWPAIKKRIEKDAWARSRVEFWQVLYRRLRSRLQEEGVRLRTRKEIGSFPERMTVAQQIRKTRMQAGYTQKELAEKLGVIQQYVSKIESGRENVTIDTLKKIADVLDRRLTVQFT